MSAPTAPPSCPPQLQLPRAELDRVDRALAALKDASWLYFYLRQHHRPSEPPPALSSQQSLQLTSAVTQLAVTTAELQASLAPLRQKLP